MRRGFSTDVYIEVGAQDSNPGAGVRLGLQGTSAPGGDTGDQDAASIGSLFHRTDNGAIYRKKANAGALADWEELGTANISNLVWRQEKVRFATGDTLSAGTFDITSLTDNEGMVIGDITVGEHCIGDVDGTPTIFEITDKPSGDNITIATVGVTAIADNNTFVVQQYLPDTPAAQEAQAIIHFPTSTSAGIKIGDFNWALADGITLNGYSDTVGAVTGTDTVQVAIQKIEKGLKDLISVMGVSRNDTNLGAFSAPATLFLTGTESVKSALQKLANLHAQIRGVEVVGVTTLADIDVVPVADANGVLWLVEYFETATPANRGAFQIYAHSDGASVDYTNPYAKLKLGSNIAGKQIDVDVNASSMRLRMGFTPSCTVTARRIQVNKSTL